MEKFKTEKKAKRVTVMFLVCSAKLHEIFIILLIELHETNIDSVK